jgi:hypothetical protein
MNGEQLSMMGSFTSIYVEEGIGGIVETNSDATAAVRITREDEQQRCFFPQ